MRAKRFFYFFVIYLLMFSSVFIFFNPVFMKEIPKMKIYTGSLDFSGEEAYKKLEHLVKTYPKRDSGLKNNTLSAEWILKQFNDLGLKAYTDSFEFTDYIRNVNIFFKNIFSTSMNSLLTHTNGTNIYAVSEGESEEVIVVGAHRDTIMTIDGAEDNGSGTASMLELARVLSASKHYYTYVFVSFDAEEVGLVGSKAFVSMHKDLSIKLAVCLDVVGSRGADKVGIFQYTNSTATSPMWTVGLSQNIADSLNKELYYFISTNGTNKIQNNSLDIFKTYFALKTADYVGTDSGSFFAKGIPAVGFMATKEGEILKSKTNFRQIHTPEDSLDRISPNTLEMVGKFTEQYIKSIEMNNKSDLSISSKNYMILGDKYVPSFMINGFIIFMAVMCLSTLLLTYGSKLKEINISSFIRREVKVLVVAFIVSFISVFWWLLLKMDFFREIPITFFIIAWFVIVLSGVIITGFIRKKHYVEEITDSKMLIPQKAFLNSLFFILFLLIGVIYNFLIAVAIMFPALLVLGRLAATSSGKNTIRSIVYTLALVLHILLSINFSLRAFKFDLTSPGLMLLGFICIFSWIVSFIYGPASLSIYRKSNNNKNLTSPFNA